MPLRQFGQCPKRVFLNPSVLVQKEYGIESFLQRYPHTDVVCLPEAQIIPVGDDAHLRIIFLYKVDGSVFGTVVDDKDFRLIR